MGCPCCKVKVPCCADPIPGQLFVTIDTGGVCTCMEGTFTLVYNKLTGQWNTNTPDPCNVAPAPENVHGAVLACVGPGNVWNFNAEFNVSNYSGSCNTCGFVAGMTPSPTTCHPFFMTGTATVAAGNCCCNASTYTITVTIVD